MQQQEWRNRPSALALTVACPGSVAARQQAPSYMEDEGDTTTRDEGTACHWVAATLATTGEIPPVGEITPNLNFVTEEMQDAARLWVALLGTWGVPATIEQPLVIDMLPDCGGTPDAYAINYDRQMVYVADLKFGFGVVDVWPNYQLAAYAAGVLAKVPDWQDWRVTLAIVQPRRWHPQGHIRQIVLSVMQVLELLRVVRAAIEASQSPTAPLNPGSHCDCCTARGRCGALREAAIDSLELSQHDLPLESAEVELVHLQRKASLIAAHIDGLKAQISHALRSGQRSQKFELAPTVGRLEWTDPEKVQALAKLMGVALEKPTQLITPTQATGILPDAVISQYASRKRGSVQLVQADPKKWVNIFKGASNG